MSDKSLLLIDGSGYLFRAYHALPPLSGPSGQPTGAIYGVLNMLKRLLRDYAEVEKVVVVFDAPGKNFRHTLFPEYKAQRVKMPEDLAAQREPLFSILEAMGLPLIVETGVEADDVIGTLAVQGASQGYSVFIATSDKDMAQLVNEQVHLLHPVTQELLGISEITEKFGVPPSRIVDYLAFSGDASDNIPGVPKVGPKTAKKWIEQYNSLAGVVQYADQIGGQVGVNLRNSIEDLPVFEQLLTIKTNLSIEYEVKDLTTKPRETEVLRKLYADLGFVQWLTDLNKTSEAEIDDAVAFDILATEADFLQWKAAYLQQSTYIIAELFCETSLEKTSTLTILGLALVAQEGQVAYLSFQTGSTGEGVGFSWVLKELHTLFQKENKWLVGYNLKQWVKLFLQYGFSYQKLLMCDVLVYAYLVNKEASSLELEALARHYLQANVSPMQTKKVSKKAGAEAMSEEDRRSKVALRAHFIQRLYSHFEGLPDCKRPEFITLLLEMEMPLMGILAEMECRGVLIEKSLLDTQTQELIQDLAVLSEEIYLLADNTFNINSTQQLSQVLFKQLALPVLKKTPKGEPSTAESVLEILAEKHKIAEKILVFRAKSKLKSTYTEALPKQIALVTGRVHTEYVQTGTMTGRLASRNPNLQNIPIRTQAGRRIRQAFVAPAGKQLLSADYSQIELRMMAHFSQDSGLLAAFEKGEDIHAATAAEIFSLPVESVTPDARRKAKTINFGLIYGISAFGLAKQLQVTQREAQEYMQIYFMRYPGIQAYMAQVCEHARQKGYVETLFKRKLYYPEINARNMIRRKAAERAVINAPLQGSAAEIIKRAMISIESWLARHNFDCKMIMQVHDELVFEVGQEEQAEIKMGIQEHMEKAARLSVPLLVDIAAGENWDEAH